MKSIKHYKTLKQYLNAFARENKYGFYTHIIPGEKLQIIKRLPAGYRKYTTGEYVPNAYRANFGWKNTYYQHAITKIEVPITTIEYFQY